MSLSSEEFRREAVTRIDPAHAVDAEKMSHMVRPVVGNPVAAELSECMLHEGEPLRLQAEQLAEHLRLRLRDLDERESLMNGRLAELETEQRVTRLWLREREQEFTDREEAIQRQLAEQQHRARALAAEEMAAGEERQRQEHELRLRAEAVTAREQRLADQLRRLAEEAEMVRLERERQAVQQAEAEDAQQRQCLDFQERKQYLDDAESLLHGQRRQLTEELAQVAAQKELLVRMITAEHRFWNERKNQLAAEWADAQQSIVGERNRLDRREEELHQLHAEAVRLYQGASESRLAAEHVWLQLYGKTSAAEIAAALTGLREPLANQHQDTSQQPLEPQSHAMDILRRLESSAAALRLRQRALETWVARSHRQLDERENRLVVGLCEDIRGLPGKAPRESPQNLDAELKIADMTGLRVQREAS